ncbi:charged multivesicular body protein 2b-like [Dysidea avara]|uniref:charged multivesicular body protein 2b-like n=1 Tax=Dysidea avara TaxID=196820 RepID=UPI00331930D9
MPLGKKQAPPMSTKDQLRGQQKVIRGAQRQMTRDQQQLERQEKQLEAEIKRAAKQGNKQLLNVLAKQLVALRKQKTRSMVVNSKMTGISHQLKATQTTSTMAGALGTSTRAMATVNAAINPSQLQHTLQSFERETTKMDMAGELMDETLDDILAGSDEEEASDQLVSQVLDEIGLETTSKLAAIPQKKQDLELPTLDTTADLEQRLAKLHS